MNKLTRICLYCQKEFHIPKKRPNQIYCKNLCQIQARSNKTKGVEKSFWSRVKVGSPDECWEWQGFVNSAGYGVFSWGNKNTFAHRFSYSLSKSKISNDLFVCHTCDNPPCCNPAHLWLGTAKDNAVDCVTKGHRGKWKYQNQVEIANEIKIQYATGNFTQEQLASYFGYSQSSISRIILSQVRHR